MPLNMNTNLTNIKPLIKYGIALVVIVLIVFTFSILTSERNNNSQEYKPPEPSPVVPQKIPQPVTFKTELSKIKPILPYSGNNYSIEYRDYLNAVEVEITAENREGYLKTKKQAEDFLKSKGLTDICSLNIFWIANIPRDKRADFDGSEVITTGCPGFKQ